MDSCRTCLRASIADRGCSLFDLDVRPATNLLVASTSLKISEDDGLPGRICDECFSKLSSFQAFCRVSIESDITFRKLLHVKDELCDEGTAAINFSHIDNAERPTTQVGVPERCPSIKSESKWSGDDDDCDDQAAADDDVPDHQHIEPKTSKNSSPNQSRLKKKYKEKVVNRRPADKPTKYTCDECGRNYSEKKRLAGHLRQHFGLRAFPCDLCPKQFDKYCKLRDHLEVHAPSPEKMTMCPHEGCGKSFKLPRYAQDHYNRIHMGLTPKVTAECMCDTCGKSFKTRSSLLQHIKSHMDIDQYPYQCEVCDKRFLAKYNHNLHMLRHENQRKYPCPLCPARMVSQLEVKTHISRVHDKSVAYPCSECKAVFHRKAHLRTHELRVHRGYKPHVCSFCNRAFGTKVLLVKHERLHTGERPFACPICDRRFVCVSHRNTHVKSHSKQKDDNCS